MANERDYFAEQQQWLGRLISIENNYQSNVCTGITHLANTQLIRVKYKNVRGAREYILVLCFFPLVAMHTQRAGR